MKRLIILSLLLYLGTIYCEVDSRYNAGLNLPFNLKSGEVNPQTGDVSIRILDLNLPGRGGFSFSFSRNWSLTGSNIFSMDISPDTGGNRLGSNTIEASQRLGVGWNSSIPYLKRDLSTSGEVLHLFFNGAAYQVDLGSVDNYNPNKSNIIGYYLIDKRIYSGFIGSKISYGNFSEYQLPQGDFNTNVRSKYLLILSDNSKFYFNANGRLMMEVDPSGKNMNWYFYDYDEKLKVIVDSVGREIDFKYDDYGNLIEISYSVDIWAKDDQGNRYLSKEKRSIKYSYESCESIEDLKKLKDKVIAYKEPFSLKGVTNQIGELTEYNYESGNFNFSFDGEFTKTNIYLMLTSILNNCDTENGDKKFSSGKFYEYKLPHKGIYRKYFYKGYLEYYKVSRTYLKNIEGRVMYDTNYTYFDDGKNGNYNQYSTRIQKGGIIENYYYSLSDSPNLLNVLKSHKIETEDGFLEESFFSYDNNKTKTLNEVFRGSKIYEEKFFYDKKGNLTEHIDRRGLITKKQYHPVYNIPIKENKILSDETYELEWIIDDVGRVEKSIIYQSNGKEITPIVLRDILYDEYSNPLEINDPLGTTYITYDSFTNSRPLYSWREVTIDKLDNWQSPLVNSEYKERTGTRKIFNSDGSIFMEFDGDGNGTEYYYDELGRVIETIYSNDNDKSLWIKELETLPVDISSMEQFTSYLESRKDNPGLKNVINDREARVEIIKDLEKSRSLTINSTIEYDGLGNPLREYSNNGVTTKTYDSYGRMVALTDPDSSETYTNIVVNGSTIKKYDSTWIIKYDDLGRMIKVLYPSTSPSTDIKYITYNDRENSSTTTDPLGRTSKTWKDWSDSIIRIENFSSNRDTSRIYQYSYDELGRKVQFIDPLKTVTDYFYNERDLLTQVSYGDSGSDFFKYDDAGLLIEKIDRNSNKIVTGYNEEGNPVVISRYLEDGQDLEAETFISYNNIGQKVRIETNELVEFNTYDSRGRIKSLSRYFKDEAVREEMTSVQPMINNCYTFTYTYFDNNSIKSMLYPDGTATDYNYLDKTGLLDSISNEGSAFLDGIKYNNSGVVTSMNWENGITQKWSFDNRKRINEISVLDSGELIESLSYSLNSVGEIDRINSNEYSYSDFGELESSKILIPGNVDKIAQVIENFGSYNVNIGDYNRDKRVNGIDHHLAFINDITSGTFDKESYTYDNSGNRESIIQNGDLYTYTYGKRNRLLGIKKNGTKFIEFVYDKNGNCVKKTEYSSEYINTTTYDFDSLNRLVSTTKNGITTTYIYDSSNNRVLKDSNDGKTIYLRHGNLAVAMDIILTGYMDQGEVNKYLLSGDLIAGRIKTIKKSTGESSITKSYYHLDHLNSTKLVTNEQGEIDTRYEYRAFGEQLKRTDNNLEDKSDTGKYSYSGKEYDSENGLYYFNQRYYDPTIGRFINLDPIQDGTNWYLYCSNNPLNMVDPTGLSYISDLSTTKNFVDKRESYINKYQNLSLEKGTVINETKVSDGNTAEHRKRTMSKGTLGNLFVSDYAAKIGTPIYTGRENTFKTDALRWSYNDDSIIKNKEGDVVRVGQGFGRRIVSEISLDGDKQQLVYAHLDNNSQIDRDFLELQNSAITAKRESFTLPEKVQIGEVGMTGHTTGPHLHYERNQIED